MSERHESAVIAERVCASYGTAAVRVPVLENASFRVDRGGITAITGPSGSGKTTLLSLIGGLDRPESGKLIVADEEISALGRRGLARFRRLHVGFVFQSFNLLPTLTVRENVVAGLEPLALPRVDARRHADAALDAVGLLELAERFPNELSGGEQQRVAVARACAKDPPLLLADEPTGNLDEEASEQVLDLLVGSAGGNGDGRTLIVATHDPLVAARAGTVLKLRGHEIHPA